MFLFERNYAGTTEREGGFPLNSLLTAVGLSKAGRPDWGLGPALVFANFCLFEEGKGKKEQLALSMTNVPS